MAQSKRGGRGDSSGGGGDRESRRRTRRKRTVLNLGMPFIQMDDFVNQSEDTVALGYKVLEQTIEEIKKGYKDAQDFNDRQRKFEKAQRRFDRNRKGPVPVAPAIPWEQLVDRVQNMQNIAREAFRNGSEIFFDSMNSGMKATRRLARTWTRSREDVDAQPVLAGPVFEDPIEFKGKAGEAVEPIVRPIRHKGLTRLRIDAVVDPLPVEIRRPGKTARKGTEGHSEEQEEAQTFAGRVRVSFAPATNMERYDETTSLLTVSLGEIPANQNPGLYEGFIRASNFELLIARLRIRVMKGSADTTVRVAHREAL